MENLIRVWTDGACFPNPGMGGWGWTTLQGEEGSGGLEKTTNQVMELTATIEAIDSLYRPGANGLLILTDSMYVIKGATEWSSAWKQNGWLNARKQPVANQLLWEALLERIEESSVFFEWVKGHSGDPGNDEADRLATLASKADAALIKRCRKSWHSE